MLCAQSVTGVEASSLTEAEVGVVEGAGSRTKEVGRQLSHKKAQSTSAPITEMEAIRMERGDFTSVV
jgi:hypothetical protein